MNNLLNHLHEDYKNHKYFNTGGSSRVILLNDKYLIKQNTKLVLQAEIEFLKINNSDMFQKIIYVDPKYDFVAYSFIPGDTMKLIDNVQDVIQKIVSITTSYPNCSLDGFGYLNEETSSWSRFLKDEVTYSSLNLKDHISSRKVVNNCISVLENYPFEKKLLHGDFGTHNFIQDNGVFVGVIDPMPVIGDYLYDLLFAIVSNVDILSSLSFAQDIIITKDKERIQAKILEVSQDEIKYKKFTYQDGPIFSIDIDEVVTVAYENGEVEVYDEETIEEKNEIIQAKAEALRKQEAMFGTFSKEDDFYYLYDRDKTTKMDQKAYLQFIQDNCPEAYRSYQKGNTLWKAGLGMLGSGLGMTLLLGTPLYAVGIANENVGCLASGSVFITIGSLATAGSIPLLVVGGIKRNNSYEVYNDHCKNPQYLSFSINAKANGVGLALNF